MHALRVGAGVVVVEYLAACGCAADQPQSGGERRRATGRIDDHVVGSHQQISKAIVIEIANSGESGLGLGAAEAGAGRQLRDDGGVDGVVVTSAVVDRAHQHRIAVGRCQQAEGIIGARAGQAASCWGLQSGEG